MLHFKGSELLLALSEAVKNKCQIALVKDHGVYVMSEEGEFDPETKKRKHIVYAQGCNPEVDEFDDWWARSRAEMGGDDCVEYLDPKDDVFQVILEGGHDLTVTASKTSLRLEAVRTPH